MTLPSRVARSSHMFSAHVTRNAPHTIRFWIKFNPGPDNDVVGIFIDGAGVGRCFTTWENSNTQTVPISDRLLFRSTGAQVTQSLVGGGYLFDNVTTTTANGPGPAADCGDPPIDIDKTTQTRFARPGDLITYRISVRNRGDAPVRGLRACDRAPRALRFVRSSARLHRAAGRRLCLTTGRAAARSAQDVPRHLPAARERHGGDRHQRRERGHPHRVRADNVPARHRRPPRAAATPGR